MSKKNKTTVLLKPEEGRVDEALVARAFELRRDGLDYAGMAEELGVEPFEAQQLALVGFSRLAAEETEVLRAQTEARYDDVLRRLYSDLRVATSQNGRNSIYALILKTEAQRTKLLGLDLPPEALDA
ncbi:hypothetical protein [Labedella endophytica]|uniref:Uncharacterized protein n=1 Tax=Labedella endophytica TaxID=1523160 RepID=A0A433JTY5_9MICO|nr:hypothetical protein [Labedella endophytica]RUR01419.1 hypothetical protein ELQ94_07940 [Labedella endophytica]